MQDPGCRMQDEKRRNSHHEGSGTGRRLEIGMDVKGKKVTVIGLGKSGSSAAKWLARHGADVTVSEIKEAGELDSNLLRELRGLGVKLEAGGHRRETLCISDFIVISPGVPLDMTPLLEARKAGIPVIGELELASRGMDIPILAVTGTNGKSTVTALLGALVRNAGYETFVGGNIGTPLIDYLAEGRKADYAVVEVSSFQLDTAERFSPHVAILLNITPDHLDRYPDYEAYEESKLSIFRNQGKNGFAVLNDDDTRLSSFTPGGPAVLRYGMKKRENRHAWVEDRILRILSPDGRESSFDLKDFALPGAHNIGNLMAAVLAGTALKIAPKAIAETIASFRALPHRMEPAGRFREISFYDDSKATNVDSALRAVLSFKNPVVLIAGGRHKGADYEPLVKGAKDRVRKAVLIGEAGPLIADSLKGEIPFEFARDMKDAVARSFAAAKTGDVVLLAPACSSFDMYTDYAHRGRVFKQAVEDLRGGK
ncbi:MAG: UDP-N-acetylmuramoyl-L-alanine--D-glutamate ligase [Desulfobacteraceae bacterium]|nr:MAG: UDP-N-acetylmuramoyl-L-alanine--D-glutamate ligase [Desulfobacteraceae bacterium]